MKFNSQICTTREQSERLLALGLKKETVDMCWTQEEDGWGELQWYCRVGTFTQKDAEIGFFDYIPAWSLNRLIEMLALCPYEIYPKDNVFEDIIYDIEEAINEGYFNKEYLEDDHSRNG